MTAISPEKCADLIGKIQDAGCEQERSIVHAFRFLQLTGNPQYEEFIQSRIRHSLWQEAVKSKLDPFHYPRHELNKISENGFIDIGNPIDSGKLMEDVIIRLGEEDLEGGILVVGWLRQGKSMLINLIIDAVLDLE